MLLFFDARYIRTDFHDGISRYSAELGVALSKLTPVTFLICDKAQLKLLPKNAQFVLIHAPTSIREPLTALILNKYHPDVVFSPMQTMGSFGRQFKLILTLHDMIYYRHRTPPHQLSPAVRLGWRLYHATYVPQRITLNSADIIATVSQTSKDDILKASLTNREVIVIPNAAQNLGRYLDSPVDLTATPKNLVYMGSFMRYKNVETLIAGMEFLPGYSLHLLSRITPKRKGELSAHIPKDSKVIFHCGVTDEKYAQLLADNALMVSASLDEGYGLPIAEAQTLGVPAVISDIPIFHEVAGESALYFDPTKPEEFADQVKNASKVAKRESLAKAGTLQSQKFSWDNSATTLLESIHRITN
ncbi:glycosyltransferase family 4 protein [Candidatus Saccharibacteria bacterium]|nr:glycosyltransferase family 4 protein [Candidatus Saccharibacteria bacterium]